MILTQPFFESLQNPNCSTFKKLDTVALINAISGVQNVIDCVRLRSGIFVSALQS